MKKTLALLLALMMVLSLCACGAKEEAPAEAPAAEAPAAAPAAPAAAEVTWADYQAYLVEKAGANAPDLAEFEAQVAAIGSWEELDQTVSPWDQMFSTIGLSTWEEFQAGTVKEPAVMGSSAEMDATASAEPAADASAEPPAAIGAENGAHGGTAGATTEDDYKAYLKAWLDYEKSVNTTMDDTMKAEFVALIEAGDYVSFPADMLFNGMLNTGSAMTYDQFVAANGIY